MVAETRLHSIDEFLVLFSRVKPIGQNQWQALCPAHSDHEPSLNIKLVDHKILVHCLAGCLPNAIVQAVGLTMASLYLDNTHGPSSNYPEREIVCSYPYHDSSGKVVFEVVRFKPKSFAQRRPDGSWGLRGVTPVIYHLPEVLKAIADGERILVSEGEKDTDNLRAMGFCATCNPMGALKWRSSYAESLKGAKEVVVFADNDGPGRKHARQVAQSLRDTGILVKVIEMPGAIRDISDWLNAGLNRDKLLEVINAAPPWEPTTSTLDAGIPTTHNRTDLGNAERLMSLYGDDIRYCYERRLWLIWQGTHWQWDYGGEIMRLAQKTVRTIYEEAAHEDDEDERKKLADWGKTSESNMRLNAIVAQAEPLAKISLDRLDANYWLFNAQNGTIDLHTGELRPANKEDYLTVVAPVEYIPTAQSNLWDQFLNRIFDNNKNLITYLQRCIGYTLTGNTSEQTLFFCYGSGMNGKSTFLNVFMDVMAPYAAQADIEIFLSSFKPSKSGHSEDIASLAGKRFVAASEIEEGRRLAVPKLKHLTGGERIRASHKHEREFEYEVTYKIWLNSNHKPDITDTTYSIWRRVKLIPFNVVIPVAEQDKRLREKMKNEYPAILAWAVQGCLDWQQSGLAEPREVTQAVAEYRQEQDVLSDFLKACCVLEPRNAECVISHKGIYAGYEKWCEGNSMDPVTSRTFSRRLKEKDTARKFISGGQMKWRFIRLLREGEEPPKVDEVDIVDEFPSYSIIKENIENNIGKPPTSATSSTPQLPLSSTLSTKENPGQYPIHPCPKCGAEWALSSKGQYYCSECGFLHPVGCELCAKEGQTYD